MYARIKTGGKQGKGEAGQVLNVEKLGREIDDVLEFTPVMLVDGDTVLATPSQLAGATVIAKVVGKTMGPTINGFTYKNKSNQRNSWGQDRQSVAKGKSVSVRVDVGGISMIEKKITRHIMKITPRIIKQKITN